MPKHKDVSFKYIFQSFEVDMNTHLWVDQSLERYQECRGEYNRCLNLNRLREKQTLLFIGNAALRNFFFFTSSFFGSKFLKLVFEPLFVVLSNLISWDIFLEKPFFPKNLKNILRNALAFKQKSYVHFCDHVLQNDHSNFFFQHVYWPCWPDLKNEMQNVTSL